VFFSCCGSVEGNGLSTGLSTKAKYIRRLCSFTECSSPDAAASRCRTQWSKHRPKHQVKSS
jgi:hypothetical protein